MTPSTDAVKAAMEKAGYHANVSAVMAILQAAYDVDVDALRAENARLFDALDKSDSAYANVLDENAKLREALKPFAALLADDDDSYIVATPSLADLRAARAVMGESDDAV